MHICSPCPPGPGRRTATYPSINFTPLFCALSTVAPHQRKQCHHQKTFSSFFGFKDIYITFQPYNYYTYSACFSCSRVDSRPQAAWISSPRDARMVVMIPLRASASRIRIIVASSAPLHRGIGNSMETNQVDAALQPGQQPHESRNMRRGVVDPGKNDIFETNAPLV